MNFPPKKSAINIDKWAFRISPHPYLSKFIAFPFLFIDIYRVFIEIYCAKGWCDEGNSSSKRRWIQKQKVFVDGGVLKSAD